MYTVYTTTQAIHSVPKDGLDEIGPETLKAITGISEEVPWDEKKLKAFKAKQSKKLELEKAEFESRVSNESVESWGEDNPIYFLIGFDHLGYYNRTVLSAAQLGSLRNIRLQLVAEKDSTGRVKEWSQSKVQAANTELARRGDNEKREAKKAELNSKIAELQKQLRELK
jgi:hypothetical protein